MILLCVLASCGSQFKKQKLAKFIYHVNDCLGMKKKESSTFPQFIALLLLLFYYHTLIICKGMQA